LTNYKKIKSFLNDNKNATNADFTFHFKDILEFYEYNLHKTDFNSTTKHIVTKPKSFNLTPAKTYLVDKTSLLIFKDIQGLGL
jgi:hypothetical protein